MVLSVLAAVILVSGFGTSNPTEIELNVEETYACFERMGRDKAHLCMRTVHRPCIRILTSHDDDKYRACSYEVVKQWRRHVETIAEEKAGFFGLFSRIGLPSQTGQIYERAQAICQRKGVHTVRDSRYKDLIARNFCDAMRYSVAGYHLETGENYAE